MDNPRKLVQIVFWEIAGSAILILFIFCQKVWNNSIRNPNVSSFSYSSIVTRIYWRCFYARQLTWEVFVIDDFSFLNAKSHWTLNVWLERVFLLIPVDIRVACNREGKDFDARLFTVYSCDTSTCFLYHWFIYCT